MLVQRVAGWGIQAAFSFFFCHGRPPGWPQGAASHDTMPWLARAHAWG